MDTRNKAIYLLVIDYLAQMAEAHLISPAERDAAQKLAAGHDGSADIWSPNKIRI